MNYSINITILCFLCVSITSCFKFDRNGRNLTFPNILKNYFTKYPVFKRKSKVPILQNHENKRKFPYKIIQPARINHQEKPKSDLSKHITDQIKTNLNFVQNPTDEHFSFVSDSNLHFMQNREADFIKNFRSRNSIQSMFDNSIKFSNDGSNNLFHHKESGHNMVQNVHSKSGPGVKIPKQLPAVRRNGNIKDSVWNSWNSPPRNEPPRDNYKMSPSRNIPEFQEIMAAQPKFHRSYDLQTTFNEETSLNVRRRNFVINNNNLYSTEFSSNGKKSKRPPAYQNSFKREPYEKSTPSNEDYHTKNIFYGKRKQETNKSDMSNSDRRPPLGYSPNKSSQKLSIPFLYEKTGYKRHDDDSANQPFISSSLGDLTSASSLIMNRATQPEQSLERRKLSVPRAKSGWTPLDEELIREEEEEYYDDYSYSSDYNYEDRANRRSSQPASYIDQLQFKILSSPVDIPKLGVQDDFKPIEVLYNEMFQEGSPLQSSKQARSFENKYRESVSWVTSRPPERVQTSNRPPVVISNAPIRQTSAPFRQTSAPFRQTSAPFIPTSAPFRPTSAPFRQTSAPFIPTSAPFRQTSAPFRPNSAPTIPNSGEFRPTRPTSSGSRFQARKGLQSVQAGDRRNLIHDTTPDFEFRKTSESSRDSKMMFLSSENILHAIVQNELSEEGLLA